MKSHNLFIIYLFLRNVISQSVAYILVHPVLCRKTTTLPAIHSKRVCIQKTLKGATKIIFKLQKENIFLEIT